MARFSNPFHQDPSTIPPDPIIPAFDLGGAPARQVRYQDPTAEIGHSLATALFGDPAAAAKQRQMQAEQDAREAQAEQDRARARHYAAQADGQAAQNTSRSNLSDVFTNSFKTVAPVAPRAPMGMESDDGGEIAGTPGVTAEQSFKSNLPNLLATLAQSGYGGDVGKFTQAAAAFAGGDDLARRALISDGHTPGKDFSMSTERDDAIAARDSSAKLLEALGVARVNHSNDIPVANIRAGASRDVALTNHRDDIAVAQIGANGRVEAAGARGGGANRLGALVSSLYPDARLTSQDRTPAEQQALVDRGVTKATPGSTYHVPGHGGNGIDMAPIPGKSLSQIVADLSARGETVLEAKVEKGGPNDGTGPHWHIAVADRAGKPSAWAKAPPKLSSADDKSIENALALLWNASTKDGGGSTAQPSFSAIDLNGPSKTLLKARTADLLQSGGNVASAAQQATREYWAAVRANRGKVAAWKPGQPITAARGSRPMPSTAAKPSRSQAPADRGNPNYPDAKRAPDGNLYVVISPKGAPVRYGMVPG